MRFRQSTLKTWMACPLQAYFSQVAGLPTKQGSRAAFGTAVHAALEHYNKTGHYDEAVRVFLQGWDDPRSVGAGEIEVWNKGSNYGSLRTRGLDILRTYNERMNWQERRVIAAEHRFLVPFGRHELTGTVDLLEVRKNHRGKELLLVTDYKTGTRKPSIAELALNIQFSVYIYATHQPEFWLGNGRDFPPVPNGEWMLETLKDLPRRGLWVHLWDDAKELDAGGRDDDDFGRLYRLCDEIERAVQHDVYVPHIGDACTFCLAAETEVVTEDGTYPIKDLAHSARYVLTDNGHWVLARFDSFGQQQLWEIVLSRGRERKTIFATAEHRWFVNTDRRVETTTAELKVGNRLVALIGQGIRSLAPSPWGVAHGIVFGDGHADRDSCAVDLYGAKRELVRFFPLSKTASGQHAGYQVEHVSVTGLPWAWKTSQRYPDLAQDRSYLYGWLAGYFATDGHISVDGQVTLSSADRDALEFVRDACYRLGIVTHRITHEMRVGKGVEPTPLYRVTFVAWTLTPEFFVRGDQRRRFAALDTEPSVPRRRAVGWKVQSVRPTDRFDEVYCARVPGTHTFMLEDNILTGNCDFSHDPCPVTPPSRDEWEIERLEDAEAWA